MNRERLEILQNLSELLDKKLITREEFDGQKDLLLKNRKSFGLLNSMSYLSRLLTPQVIILIILLLFLQPIRTLLSNASEVALGDTFSFKVEEALKVLDPDMKKKIQSLTKEEINVLLKLNEVRSISATTKVERDNNIELILFYDELDIYVSLQRKGIIESPENINKIQEILKTKKPYVEPVFDESVNTNSLDKRYVKEHFTKEELIIAHNSYLSLSPVGRRIFDLILDITSDEFSKLK